MTGGEGDGDENDADVDDHAAVGSPDEPAPALAAGRQRQLTHGRAGRERSEPEGDERRQAAETGRHAQRDDERCDRRRPEEPLAQHLLRRLAPRQHRSHRHEKEQGDDDRRRHTVEVRTTDRQAVTVESLGQEREHRAEQHDEGERREQEIVGEEGALARHR